MTIREALEQYKAQGPEAVHDGFREAVELLIKNHVNTPLENDSYLDALFLTDLMFQRTNQKLTILTGSNADQFLDALHVSFEKALERIRKTSGIARMIILDNEIPKTVSTLASRFAPLVQIRRGILKPGAKINHIIACDSTMIRVEEHHEPLTLDSDADAVKAKVFFDNAEEVKARLGFFDAAWELLGN